MTFGHMLKRLCLNVFLVNVCVSSVNIYRLILSMIKPRASHKLIEEILVNIMKKFGLKYIAALALGCATFFIANYKNVKSSIHSSFSNLSRRRLSLYLGEEKCK